MAASANSGCAIVESPTLGDKRNVLLAQGARRFVSRGMAFAQGLPCGHRAGWNHFIIVTEFRSIGMRNVLRNYGGVMRKLFLVSLIVACTLVAASASAAEVETIALFDPAAFETPESIQIDRH